MPKLPRHVIGKDKKGKQYTIHFITIEREPGVFNREHVMQICQEEWPTATIRAVYAETSRKNYSHFHAVIRTPKETRWVHAKNRIQKDPVLGSWKWGSDKPVKDRLISVGFYHTRKGSTEDAACLMKYCEEPYYDAKEVDGEPLYWEADPLLLAEAGLCWASEKPITTCMKCFATVSPVDFFLDIDGSGRESVRDALINNHPLSR